MQSPDTSNQPDARSDVTEDGEIQDYFVPGIDVDDVTSLWNLKQRFTLLEAFTTIFRGEPTGVLVRLHVLLDMSDRPAGTTSWGLSELRHHFSYLTDTAFDTVMKRLRGGGLISYDREKISYTATSLGLQVASSISYFLKSYEEEGLTLLTGVLYAGDAMGNISGEDLSHLLNRLGQLEQELQGAVDSASEPAIVSARGRFDAVWKRIEQGTDIIKRIAQNQDMDRETHKLGQKVAQAQSRLARVTTTFQRAMNDIDRQRVHLGNSGISTSDLNRYLMGKTQEELINIFEGAMDISVQPILLLTDVLSDVAEYELVERKREEKEEWKLPQPVPSPSEEATLEEDVPHLKELIGDVASLQEESSLKVVVPKESFELSSANIRGVKREVTQLDERVRGLIEDEKKASSEDIELKGMVASFEKELEAAQTALIEENSKRSIAQTQLEEIKKLREACMGVEPEPVDPLQADLNTTVNKRFSVEHDLQDLAGAIQDLHTEKMSLLSNQMKLDKPIELFHKKLTTNGIGHTLLYENIEVTDEKWRVAIESILKGYRYVILLKNPSDRWKAWGMGEEDGFRHFIVADKGKTSMQLPQRSALSVIRLSEDVPEWVRRLLADIQLVEGVAEGKNLPEGATFVTAKGFMRERRGGRSIAVSGSDFAFGEMGRKKRLESIEKQIAELEAKKNDLNKQLKEIQTAVTGLQERIGRQEALQKYFLRKTDEENFEVTYRTAMGEVERLEAEQRDLSKKKHEIQDKREEVLKKLTSITVNLSAEREKLGRKKEDLNSQREDRCARYKELRKIRKSMPEHWRASEALSKYRAKFDGVKSVQRAIENIDEEIEKGEWEKDGSIVAIKDKVEKDYQGEKANLELKEGELSETKRVTQEARGAYIEYLRASLRFYERNIKVLAELAKVDIEVVKPHLENDDIVLRETGLEVKWNFDNKGFTATDDGEGSGGQQVIKSLILLIGLLMAEGDNGGFVFIDEPFAHLDVFNIDKVAEFLMATNTQYIITSPNTHNKNVYRPAFLTLVTRKKRPDSPFAEPPGHLRRMEERNA